MAPHRLGIVDWGIGGLGLLGLLDDRLPSLDVSYWSDTGSVPYGLQATGALAARLRTIVDELAGQGCTEVVLACNAASTVVDRLGAAPVPVTGIIAAGIDAVDAVDAGAGAGAGAGGAEVVGVVAGRRTIRSGAYRRGLARPGRRVVSRIAQPLSAHIEAGRIDTPAFDADLHRIVEPLRGADAVVLACTHYPAATASFARALPGARLVDPADHLSGQLVQRLGPTAADGTGDRTFTTTGDPDLMRSSAAAAWGMDLPQISVS